MVGPPTNGDEGGSQERPPSRSRVVEHVLGVEVDVITRTDLIARVVEAMRVGERLWVANHNLHSAHLVTEDKGMREWYERADLVFVDGMSLVAASRIRGGPLRRAHRATLLDWMPDVLTAAASEGRVVFHLGGDPSWIGRGAAVLEERHAGLRLHVYHGFFRGEDAPQVVSEINRVAPDVLLIGMGMPLQEHFAAAHAEELTVPVIVTVGAFMAYAAGAATQPPRWVGRWGLEWAWRLAGDPRRLSRRYLIEPYLLARALLRRRGT